MQVRLMETMTLWLQQMSMLNMKSWITRIAGSIRFLIILETAESYNLRRPLLFYLCVRSHFFPNHILSDDLNLRISEILSIPPLRKKRILPEFPCGRFLASTCSEVEAIWTLKISIFSLGL